MRKFVVGASIVALAAAAQPAAAQTTIGWDASLFSSYVWRGLTYTNKPVLQPDLYVTIPLGTTVSLTAGGWANIDLAAYDGSTDLSESGGSSAFNVAEFDWWGELGVPVGKATLTAGATGYLFPNKASSCKVGPCFTSDANTTEIYGKVALDVPLSPKVSAYYDVDQIKGLYVEGSISHGFPIGPKSLTLGALAGWTGGQEVDSDPSANFADKGITHIDLSASMGFSAGSLSITPAIHGVFGQDDFTKFTKSNSKSDFKLWGGITLAWSKGLGASKAEE
jgi:hypothetical protein